MKFLRTSLRLLAAALSVALLGTQSASAGLVANFTYDNANTNTLTMTLSGSLTVTSTNGANAWTVPPGDVQLWTGMTNATFSHFTTPPGADNKTYSVGSGISASSGTNSIVLNKVWFDDTHTGNRFSFSFSANPVFGLGDVVNFSGTAIVDLGTDKAGMFNEGTWTGRSYSGDPSYWTTQFQSGSGLLDGPELTLTTKVVPEPGTWAAAALLAGAAGFVGWRRRRA